MGINNSKLESKLDQIIADQEELRKDTKELRKETRFASGTHYAPLTQIWQQKKATFKGGSETLRGFRANDSDVLRLYQDADGTNLEDMKVGDFPSDCMFPAQRKEVGNSSLAHSAPDDKVCIFTWNEVIALVTGKQSESMFVSENLRNFVCGSTGGAKNPFRVWHWNYLKLPIEHDKYYDKPNYATAVIIAPIWDPRHVWTPGTPYKLMVSATPEAYKWLMGTTPLEEDDPQYEWLGEASEAEYRGGTEFLQLNVKALADLLNESDLIRGIEGVKQADKVNPEKTKSSLLEAVRRYLRVRFGDNFGARCFEVYNEESASRRTSNSQRSGSQPTTGTTTGHIDAAESAYANKILSLLATKKRMERLGATGSGSQAGGSDPQVFVPEMLPKLPKKPILTIDLGIYFRGKEKMIPDPYWPGMKAAASIAQLYEFPLVGACNSLRDELAKMEEEEVNDAPLPAEIEISFDCDCGSVSGSSVWSESERFTGTPGASMLEVGEHRIISPVKRQDDIASNVVTPEKSN